MAERLHKLLAMAGYGSRRKCEELILEGRVSVNGVKVTELGTKADPALDRIEVDGQAVALPKMVYVLMNKPAGYVTTVSDPHAKRTVMDLLPELPARVYPVGRLDKDTSGVLLFTNDGALANRLMHPRYGVPKTYRVVLSTRPPDPILEKLEKGVELEDGRTAPAKVRNCFVNMKTGECSVEVTVREGRKRLVRRMFEAVGFPLKALTRTRFGPLTTYKLPVGACRLLSKQEVERLRKSVGL